MNLTEVPLQALVDELKRRRSIIDISLLPFQHLTNENRHAVEAVIQAVGQQWGISKEALLSPGRTKRITDPRQAAMEMMRSVLRLTHESIGRLFSKDHGTIIHACNAVSERLAKDSDYRRRYFAAVHAIKKRSLEGAGFSVSVS